MNQKRLPQEAQDVRIAALVFGNNGYLVQTLAGRLQTITGNRYSLADRLRELADELEVRPVSEVMK